MPAYNYKMAIGAGYSNDELAPVIGVSVDELSRAADIAGKHDFDLTKLDAKGVRALLDFGAKYSEPNRDPYHIAAVESGPNRAIIPLGAALSAPVAGIRQALGNEQAGKQAIEAQEGIERTIPGGGAGMLAGKIGVGSLAAAPAATVGAGTAGLSGLATRAGAIAVPTAAVRAADPMRPDESRFNQALAAGGIAAALTPVGEGVGLLAGKAINYVASKAADIARNSPRISAVLGSRSQAAGSTAAEASLRVALRQEGVNYDKLSQEIKDQLIKQVGDHLNPQNLGQNALVRSALVEQQLGAEAAPTLGQANRSTEQMRFEQQFGGEKMMQKQAAQTAAIENKLKGMSQRIGGTGDRGVAVQTAALAKSKEADKAVSAAYKAADDAAGDAPVPVDQLADPIKVFTEITPGVDVVVRKLKTAGVQFDDAGNILPGQTISGKTMNELRKVVSSMTAPGNPQAGVGREFKTAIDGIFENSGIPHYRDAARLARANFAQFDDRVMPSTVTRTVNNAGVEPTKEASTIPKWLVSMPPEKLREFKRFLVEGNEPELAKIYANNPEIKQSGVQGVKALKAAMIDHLIESSTRKSATGEAGQWVVSPDALVTAYRKIGEKKLAAVLDAKDFANLRSVVKAAEVITTPGRAQMHGSAEANTALVRWFADKLGALGGGGIALEVGGIAKGVSKASSASKSIDMPASKMARRQAEEAAKVRLLGDKARIITGKSGAEAGTKTVEDRR